MDLYSFEVVIPEVGIIVHNWIFMKWNTSSHKTRSNVVTHVIYVTELLVIYLKTFRGPDCHEGGHGPAKKRSSPFYLFFAFSFTRHRRFDQNVHCWNLLKQFLELVLLIKVLSVNKRYVNQTPKYYKIKGRKNPVHNRAKLRRNFQEFRS